LDVAGYFYGYGYNAEIVQMVRTGSSEKHVFGIDVPALAGMVEKSGIKVNDIFHALSKADGFFLRHALSDAREAIKSPKDTGFFCYRAVESPKNCCAQRSKVVAGDEGWETFRSTYSLNKDDVIAIK